MLERIVHSPAGHLAADYTDAVRHEGLRGMLGTGEERDVMMDRAGARRELAPLFTVRDEHAPRDRLSGMTNTVTTEEFEKVARTYSDIRRGQSHLHLNTENVKPEYQDAVRDEMLHDIANIMQTRSGRSLVDGLANAPGVAPGEVHETYIQDRFATDNAEATANEEAYRKHHGADAYVRYTPGAEGGARFNGIDDWRNMRSDVTLYHELTHALHLTRGTNAEGQMSTKKDKGKFFSGDNNVDNDEAQAAGLYDYRDTDINENRYRAERNEVAESGVGVREAVMVGDDMIAQGDADIGDRDHYASSYAVPDATPLPLVNKPITHVAKHDRHRRRH